MGVVSSRWPTSSPSLLRPFISPPDPLSTWLESHRNQACDPARPVPPLVPRRARHSSTALSHYFFLPTASSSVRPPRLVAMSDEVKSTTSKPRRQRPRILVVNNPGPDSDDEQITYPADASSMSNPSYSDRAHPSASQYIPPLTTNLSEVSRPYPSSRSNPSNPALSSPSSTSSRAFESTPPPSTPGQSNHPEELCTEGTLRQEPVLVSYSDASETITPPSATSRTTGVFNRLRLHRHGHTRRSSNNARPASVCCGSVLVLLTES